MASSPCKQSNSEGYAYSLYIFNIRIRYSWIIWKVFGNRNNIRPITIFSNKNNSHEINLWQFGVGIYSWPKYQQLDLWQPIFKLFAKYLRIKNYSLSTVVKSPSCYLQIYKNCFLASLFSAEKTTQYSGDSAAAWKTIPSGFKTLQWPE